MYKEVYNGAFCNSEKLVTFKCILEWLPTHMEMCIRVHYATIKTHEHEVM